MFDIKTLMESKGLYVTQLPSGEKFTWRLLTLKEYSIFRGLKEAGTILPLFLYEEVFSYCYVGNADVINGNLPAGLFVSLGELILHLSGGGDIQNEKDEIETARMAYPADSVIETVKRIVLLAFSAYTPDDIEKWTRPELLRKFTIAEAVLVNRGGYEKLDTRKIMTSEQMAKKQKSPPIDFRKENMELDGKMGDAMRPHMLDMPPEALAAKQAQTNKLERLQAQKLEKALAWGR